jgi:hypothetical protein
VTTLWWPEPSAGDVVWCHFPDNIHPKPKPRPALVIEVYDDDDPQFHVKVAYGTSQRKNKLYRGEFCIFKSSNATAYSVAGVSFSTKFDLKQILTLPFSTDWFSVPPAAPHGQIPRLGMLHPSLVPALQVAYGAAHPP